MAIPIDPTRPSTLDPGVLDHATGDPATGDGQFRAATYNLGGANEDAKQSVNIQDTTRLLAEQMVDGVDVVALQEIDVGTRDAYNPLLFGQDLLPKLPGAVGLTGGIDDYNEYVLAQISATEQGLQGDVAFSRVDTTDAHGKPITVITGQDAEGRTSRVTITRESYTADGAPLTQAQHAHLTNGFETIFAPNLLPTTVYSAQVQTPTGLRDYTVAYGPSTREDGGTYGNAILLGPAARLQRDDNGNAAISRHDLRADDPGGENRTSLRVDIDVAGTQATVFDAHLSHKTTLEERFPGLELERRVQFDALADLADATGDNTLLLGDFNSENFQSVGPLTGENDGENAVDPDDTAGGNIDRIYVSADVAAINRDELVGQGGSDHEMITWNIDLDR